MIHQGERCLSVVDRSVDPVVHLDYTIPQWDTCLGPAEVSDSRTHQYVAFCRAPLPWESLPHWLDHEDVVDSLEAMALAQSEVPPQNEILELTDAWADCHAVVGTDDDRRSIHCSEAVQGIDWDTTGVASGVWVLQGYTYQPPLNMWTPRVGVFKIVDGPDDDPPAAGLYPHADRTGDDPLMEVTACVDAEPGSTVSLSCAEESDAQAQWIELASATVDEDGDVPLQLDFSTAFDEATAAALRVRIETPSGESFEYISPKLVTYIPGPTTEQPPPPSFDYCEDPAKLEPQECPMGPTSGTDTSMEDEDSGKDGCGCRTGGGAGDWGLVGLLGVLVGWRRAGRRVSGPDTGT